MIEIEIDGKKVQAPQGTMLIEAAEAAGIYIPRFCYHKKLSVVANCRMCLIESENSKKPLPACATPVTPGMKIHTCSKMARDAQRAVMEFLLINHPLDCPICDQGGECELQDLALGYGKSISRFTEGKRSVKDKNLGSLIATDMTRCIHCTRCVRFGEEIAGLRELGATGRGEQMEIGTYIEKAVRSELSGNVIDLCPVGALTSKPYRYTGRSWELTQHASIAPHDCIGTNIYIHTRFKSYSKDATFMRVLPRDNEAINETWLADRERFSYLGFHTGERLRTPQIKSDGVWQSVDWQTALKASADSLKSINRRYGADQLGALAHPSATSEEFYLLQKIMRGLGCSNIDHRIRALDTSDQALTPVHPSLGIPLAKLEVQTVILLIGSNIRQAQPLACHRIRKAASRGAHVLTINPVSYDLGLPVAKSWVVGLEYLIDALASVAKALCQITQQPVPEDAITLLESVKIQPDAQQIAQYLQSSGGSDCAILLGEWVEHHPQSGTVRTLAHLIALLLNANYGRLTSGANAAGAWLAGALPHRAPGGGLSPELGLSATEMWEKPLKAYITLGFEPDLDTGNPHKMVDALDKAECVIALSAYRNASIEKTANIILPIGIFAETSGTFVNVEGTWQSFEAVTAPPGEARPAWKVLRVLGNLLALEEFNYSTSLDVLKELQAWMPKQMNKKRLWSLDHCSKKILSSGNTLTQGGLMRVGYWPIYRVDNMVRHSEPLQQMEPSSELAVACVSPSTAKKLGLVSGDQVRVIQADQQVILKLCVDPCVADNNVLVASGLLDTQTLGDVCGPVILQKKD